VKITLEQEQADIAPGGEVRVMVTVVNDGRKAVRPVLRVNGLDGAEAPPVGMGSLPAGASASTEIAMRLPSDAAAGVRRVSVVSDDESGFAAAVTAHLQLTTGSAEQVSIGLSPREMRGRFRDRMRIQLHNHGNETVTLNLRGKGEHVSIRIKPNHVVLPPGHSVRARANAVVMRPATRRAQRRPFQIVAQGATAPITASGTFVQRPLSPRTLFKLVAILVVLGLWIGGVGFGIKKLNPGTAKPSPTTTAKPTPAKPDKSSTGSPADSGASTDPLAASDGNPAGEAVLPGKPGAIAPPDFVAAEAPAAVVLGTIAGPPDPSGIDVVLERISIGDQPTSGAVGKILGSAVSRPTGDVLAKQATRTDEGGRFRFSEGLVLPGLYRITASKTGFDVISQVASLTPERPNVELAMILKPATGALGGKVLGDDGKPLGDATVTVRSDNVTYTAKTASTGDETGTWSIVGVAVPASYVITATAPGFSAGVAVVDLAGGEKRNDLQMTLTRGLGTVHGLVSSRGVGAGALTISAIALDGGEVRTTTTLTEAKLTGQYSFTSLPFGRYSLTLTGTGWLTQTRQVQLTSGDLVVDIDDARRSTATVVGKVFQQASDGCAYPASGASGQVRAQPCGNVGITVANDSGAWRTTSATGTGEFTVSGIPAGSYTVILERHGYLSVVLPVTLGAGDEVSISATPLVLQIPVAGEGGASVRSVARDGSKQTVALKLACLHPTISVTDSTASVPVIVPDVTGATPECAGTGTNTGATGDGASAEACPIPVNASASMLRACFTIGGGIRVDGLSPGGKIFHIQADGFDDTLVTAQIPSAGIVDTGIVMLRPLATLTGLVASGSQVPVAHARIFAVPTDLSRSLPTPSGPTDGGWFRCTYDVGGGGTAATGLCLDAATDGSYTFGRAFGTGEFRITAPIGQVPESTVVPPPATLDNERFSRTVSLVAGALETLDLQLRRRGAVYGIIQTPDASGQSFNTVGGVTVSVTDPNGIKVKLAPTGALTVTDKNGALLPASAATTRITLGADGSPDQGHFRVDRLLLVAPPGRYTLTFTKDELHAEQIDLEGGIGINIEVLRNVVMTNNPVPLAGRVFWRTDPSDINSATPVPCPTSPTIPNATQPCATVVASGTTGYRVLDTAPYRESIIGSFTTVTTDAGTFTTPTGGAQFVGGSPSVTVTAPGFTAPITTVNLYGDPGPDHLSIEVEPDKRTLNGTIVLSPSGQPDESLVRAGLTVSLKTKAGQFIGTTSVDGNGVFTFPTIRPDVRTGAYEVTVSGPGITSKSFSSKLEPILANEVQEFPNITLARTGRLTITVPNSSGTGIAGVTVSLLQGTTVVKSAITCKSPGDPGGVLGCPLGSVVFDNLDLASYTVTATLNGWFSKPGVFTSDLTNQPVLSGGSFLETGATIPVASTLYPTLTRYGRVSATVRGKIDANDLNPVALAGAHVELLSGTTSAAGGFTAPNGTVLIEGTLPSGTYTVRVSKDGYSPQLAAATVDIVNETESSPPSPITLIAATGSIYGHVYDKVDSRGLDQATISIPGFTSVKTDANGAYTLPDLPPRTYTVTFTNKAGNVSHSQVLTVGASQSVKADEFLGRPVGTIFGTVLGLASADSTNTTKLVGAVVTATAKENLDGSTPFDAPTQTANIGDNGAFTFSNIESGVYTLKTVFANYTTDEQDVTAQVASSKFVNVVLNAAPRAVTVKVKSSKAEPAPLNDILLADVSVEAFRAADPTKVVTGEVKTGTSAAAGTVALTLTPGVWTIKTTDGNSVKTVRVSGGTALDDPHADEAGAVFTVGIGGTNPTLPISLDRYETLRVIVTKRDNASTAATTAATAATLATVTASVAGGTPIPLTETSTAGTYTVRAQFSGTVTISASLANYDTSSTNTVIAVADGIASKPIILTAAAQSTVVTVRSTATNTPLVQGVVVSATGPNGQVVTAPAATGLSGEATLTLVPGVWTITTTGASDALVDSLASPHDNLIGTAVTVTVSVGTAAAKTISLAPLVGLTGNVSSVFTLGSGAETSLQGATVRATFAGLPAVVAFADQAGEFTMTLAPDKLWTLTFSAVGHTTQSITKLTTTASQDIGTIKLERIAFTLSGKVTLGTGGSGVGHVEVSYRRGSEAPASVFTGTNGTYSIPGRDPYATWEVTFDATTATTATEQRQPMTFYVLPTATTTVTLNYALSLKSGSVEVTVVSGLQNQTLTTAIVSNATVVLTDTASSPLVNPVTVTAATAAPLDAKVVIPSLPVNGTGVYRVSVTAPGYVDAAGNALPVFASNVSVANGLTTKVKVILYPVPQDVTVRVKDPNGDLVDGVDVTLGGGGLGLATRTGTTVSGVVTWPDIPVSPSGGAAYTIGIAASGYTPGTLGSYYVPAGSPATLDVQLRSVTVTASETSSSVTGTTLSDAAISAIVPGGTVPSFASNGAGGFEVKGVLPTGTWTISASRSGYTTKTTPLTVGSPGVFKQSVAVTLVPAPTVVKAQSSLANAPLAGVIVHAVSNDSPAAATVDSLATPANGTVSLALVPGSWTISTTNATTLAAGHHADAPGTSLSIPLPAGSAATTLTLDKHETLTVSAKGRVSASSAPALAGVVLKATPAIGTEVTLAPTSTTGVYSYTGPLAAGAYALSATAPDHSDLAAGDSVTVVADGTNAAKSVTLNHLESLTVTIKGKTSSTTTAALADATVTASNGTGSVTLAATSTTGEYAYQGELTGTYTITASKDGFATDGSKTIASVPFGDATKTVTLNHLESITVTLKGRNSATGAASKLSGATVTTLDGSTTRTLTEVGTTGVYVYEGQLSGSYTVKAVKDGYTTDTLSSTAIAFGDATGNLTLTAEVQTLTVTVYDNATTPAVVGPIDITATQGATVVPGTTDAAGVHIFTLPPGDWVVTAVVPYPATGPATHTSSTSHTVTVPIGSGATQTVTVSP
jgi:hypothetical protein